MLLLHLVKCIRSYSKTVQHLEGGIIKDLLVENGERVKAGDPILELDDTQPLAQLKLPRVRTRSSR